MTDYDALDWQRWAREVLTDFRVEHDDHTVALRLALVRLIHDLRAERDALAKARERLEHIAEYWNLRENDRAMSDALYHMIEEARDGIRDIDAALAAQERNTLETAQHENLDAALAAQERKL